jgi:membrane fusion protein, multidrug efflux system
MRRAVLILICVLAVAGAGYWATHHGGAPARQARGRPGASPPVPVLVASAQKQDVPIYLDALGTVQAFNTVTVHSMIDGPLVDVRFKEGQDIKAGDVLAVIDQRPYKAALDQATAKKAQDEATLANARLDLARYIKLAATNYTTQQQADTQRALVAEDAAQVEQDAAAVETAQTNLSYTTITAPLTGLTGIRQVDQGNIIHTTDTNGLVMIAQMQPISVLFTLPQQTLEAVRAAMQPGPAKVLALPQGQAFQGAPAQDDNNTAGPGLAAPSPAAAEDPPASGGGTATASAGAPADDPPGAQPVILDRGVVAVLDNQVDSATGTIKLKATFPNPDEKLWPGGFVNIDLLVRTAKGAVTVPPAAVQRGPQGAYVYAVAATDTVTRKPITVGYEDQQLAIVTSGLQAGEIVVTDGASRLSDGAHVSLPAPSDAAGSAPGPHQAPPQAPHKARAPGQPSESGRARHAGAS